MPSINRKLIFNQILNMKIKLNSINCLDCFFPNPHVGIGHYQQFKQMEHTGIIIPVVGTMLVGSLILK